MTTPRPPRVLVLDDEADLRELLEITLIKMGLDVDSAATLRQARALFDEHDYALVLTDMRLPDGLGLELVREIGASGKGTPVAVITAYGSADNAVVALKAGAFDYIAKPVALDALRVMVRSALKLSEPGDSAGQGAGTTSRLIGNSPAMQSLRAQIARLARSMAPISITGESGSGKELAAREIHAQSSRANKPFVAVNCGAIPETLMEAEFFGYRKGAFTGAAEERDGFFAAANGGTLMLDEVADLPLAMQVKLLRAIQERRVRKIGATAEEPVDVRIISATHQDLAHCVETGKFRQDLFYRLNVIELALPPLRERLDDLAMLAEGILNRLAGPGQASLGPGVLEVLKAYSFPGNVRELENVLERALAFANDGVIEVGDLSLKAARPLEGAGTREPVVQAVAPEPTAPAVVAAPIETLASAPDRVPASAPLSVFSTPQPTAPSGLAGYLDQIERSVIQQALQQAGANHPQAAAALGISERQLRYQLHKLGM